MLSTSPNVVLKSQLLADCHIRALITVRSCGLLDIPMSVKTPTVYTEGSVVTVTGCRPDNSPVQSSGPLTYVCNATGSSSSGPQWSPLPDRNLCPHSSG